MELLLNYLLKSGLCLLTLYLFYYAALRKQPNFKFNRLYLLCATPSALAIPILKWPTILATETTVTKSLRAVQLPEITIRAAGKGLTTTDQLLSGISFEHILMGIYLLGVCILLLNLIRQLIGIRKLAASAALAPIQIDGVTVLETPEHSPTFAFLSYVFISRQNHLSATEKEQVLEHELAHIQLKHTLDILYFECLTALLWFNPVVWLLRNELRDVHEYQADARVLARHQFTQYSSLLSKEVLHKSGIPVGSYFKEPQVFKRLQMLHKYGMRSSWVRPALLLPLVGGLSFVFSSQQLNAGITTSVPPVLASELNNADLTGAIKTQPEEIASETSPVTLTDQPEKATPKFIEPVIKAQEKIAEAAIKETEAKTPEVDAIVVEEKPYTYVEQMPQFEGGETELQKFLAREIKYPQAAIKANKEGLVFITFTISEEGKATNYEIVKSVSKEIDAEALRVLKLTEDSWAPGRQNGRTVPVRFTIPIRFNLQR